MCDPSLWASVLSSLAQHSPPQNNSPREPQPSNGWVSLATVPSRNVALFSVPGLSSSSLSRYEPIFASPSASVVVSLRKRIRYLLAAVDGADQHDQGAAGDGQAQGSRGLLALIVAHRLLGLVEDQVHQGVVAF